MARGGFLQDGFRQHIDKEIARDKRIEKSSRRDTNRRDKGCRRRTGGQADRLADRQAGRQADRQGAGAAGRQSGEGPSH
jgi:hypothetical protein